jgi:hypothetical protein
VVCASARSTDLDPRPVASARRQAAERRYFIDDSSRIIGPNVGWDYTEG